MTHFSSAELLQRFTGLECRGHLPAHGGSFTNGPTLGCSRQLGTATHDIYLCTPIPSPPGGKVLLTKHKSDQATPFWETQWPYGQTEMFTAGYTATSNSPASPHTSLPSCLSSGLQKVPSPTSRGSASDVRPLPTAHPFLPPLQTPTRASKTTADAPDFTPSCATHRRTLLGFPPPAHRSERVACSFPHPPLGLGDLG